MKQLTAAIATIVVVVAGLVLAVSLTSSAQEDDGADEPTPTTTTPAGEEGALEDGDGDEDGDARPFGGHFSFRFGGELPAEMEEKLACLAEQGFEVPADGAFGFDLSDENREAFHDALEACGLGLGARGFGFHGFDGDIPFDLDEFEGC